MTLIAYHGFGDGARLVFVSDIIISTTINSVNDFNLPTIGISGGVVLNNTEHKIFGLGQKVAILNSNLAVAASGTKIYYRDFAKYLGELYNKKNIYSPNDFMELIEAYLNDEDTKAGLGHFDVFVAYINIIDGRQTGAITFISSERNPRPPANYDFPLFEQVIALGSGAPSYVEVAGTMKLVSDKRRFRKSVNSRDHTNFPHDR